MKLLRCKICRGELEILGSERAINKKVRCLNCGFSNVEEPKKEPEVMIIRKRPVLPDPGTS